MITSTILAALLSVGLTAKTPKPTLVRYQTGNMADVSPALHGPFMDLSGGGVDVDEAFQKSIDAVRGCTGSTCATKIDVVILRSSGSNGYNDYLYAMNGVDSVETLVITGVDSANDPAVFNTINNAELIFFAGGDQCNYVTYFMGTLVETAVQNVYARGGSVGGISAGLAIMGSSIYDACTTNTGVTSTQTLANPFHRGISFMYDFLNMPFTANLITDTHFLVRDRMGRLMTFLARQIQDGISNSHWGLGVDEGTSVQVDANGTATVVGTGTAYLVFADHVPEVCAAKMPLTFTNFKVWKYPPGATFSLVNRPTLGFTSISVQAGALSANPY